MRKIYLLVHEFDQNSCSSTRKAYTTKNKAYKAYKQIFEVEGYEDIDSLKYISKEIKEIGCFFHFLSNGDEVGIEEVELF